MATAASNPWAPWGIVQSFRDGWPVLSETQLWQLEAQHPEAVERTASGELYVHLDAPYRVVKLPDRSWMALEQAPGRAAPAASSAPAAQKTTT